MDTQPSAGGTFVSQGIAANNGVVQTFSGISGVLASYAYFSSSISAATTGSFTIQLLDYGTVVPVNSTSQYNGSTTSLFTDTFSLTTTTNKQVYFDLPEADQVTLDPTHSYGVYLLFSNAAGSNNVSRSGSDIYSGGGMAVGTAGSFATSFTSGQRDESFGIYTMVAAPEPSTFTMLIGGFGALALKRRRRLA
ncbi:MAG: PEP-CTERM sorting domain-containing protein [Chthoniobacteraceae bacterium]